MSKTLKKEIKVYEFMRRNVGKDFFGSHLKAMFGLSTKTEFYRTRIRKYVAHVKKMGLHKGAPHMYRIMDMIWVSQDFINRNDIHGAKMWSGPLGLNLIDKKKIPWHLLEEHGGLITDHELQDRYKERYEN